MRAIFNLFFVNKRKYISTLTALFIFFGTAPNALAIFIDFDDLNPVYDPDFPCWCDNPLSDEYLDQGLRINGAWVNGDGVNNIMLTSNWASLEFVNILPTFVSMNVTSHYGDAIFLDAFGTSGLLLSKHTSGWMGLEENSTEVIPNEYISFSSDVGIKTITIQGFYNMRIGAAIDNLTFTHASVPESSSIVLMSLGLFGLMWRRIIFRKNQPVHKGR